MSHAAEGIGPEEVQALKRWLTKDSAGAILSRPGRGPNPLPAETDPPAESFDPNQDEAPSAEYLRGAVALLQGLMCGEQD